MKRSNGLTIRDVGKAANVSLGTVSRVLNQHATVSREIRQRVERAILTLGYTPNAVAQSMRSQNTRTVGCIIRDINLPALAAFVRAAHDVLFQAGYVLLLTNSEGQRHREMELVSLLSSRKTDALIIAHHSEQDEQFHSMLKAADISVVAASDSDLAQLSEPPITVESWDYAEVGRIAARIVLERINHSGSNDPRRVIVPAELIQRGSCAPPARQVKRAK